MRIFFALLFCIAVSFIITPIGGIILFVLILLFGRKKPVQQTMSQNVYINSSPVNRESFQNDPIISEEEIAAKIKNDQKKNVLRELDILHKKYRRNLITHDEYQERVKRLSADNNT